jgi:hypothetical protein
MKSEIQLATARITRLGAARRLLLVFISLAIISVPTTSSAAESEPSSTSYIKPVLIANVYSLGPTFHQLEGAAPSIQLTAMNSYLIVQKSVLGLWINVASASFGSALTTKNITLPIGLLALLIPVPQTFRVINGRTYEQIGSVQPVVVFKKPVVDLSVRWSYLTGRPVRFQCRTVTYKVDVRYAPGSNDTALAETKAAASMVSRASGIKLVYGGTAAVDSSSTQRASGADITVKYGTLPYASASTVTAGYTWMSWAGLRGTDALRKITSSKTVIKKSLSVSSAKNTAIVAHEFMHALGMGHSTSESDVMHAPVKVTALGAGDLAGLKAVGPAAGCF